MTISQITKPIKERHFATYDLEWNPDTMEPRLFGFFDGSHYRAFKSVDAFMAAILRPQYKDWWFFAHAGGLADVPFLLQWMVDHSDYEVTARFSGSAAVMVEIAKKIRIRLADGTFGWKKGMKWVLVDSFFLLRTKLRNIGAWIGDAKGGSDGDLSIFYGPWHTLRVYNEQDCRVLHKGISVFRDHLESLGGELMPTIASTAMRLFRRAYLGSDIRTTAAVNTRLRESYVASRVEVFKKRITNAYQYDINSSFPFSMTLPVPGELMFVSENLPEKESECFFADVEVTVPDGMEIPPLPYRAHNKVYFPTGTWKGWLTGVDIRFLLQKGGRVEKVREVLVYEERDDLAAYVNDLYERRRVATSDFEKVIYKFLLNSLYGKFGERTEKTSLILNPVSTNLLIPKYDKSGKLVRSGERLFPGAIIITEDRAIAHEHVPIASHVTANSRRLIGNALYDATERVGEMPAYTDTDSLITHAVLPTSDRLGELKLEGKCRPGCGNGQHVPHIDFAELYAPKFNRIDGHVKAKGFTGITSDGFQKLVDGFAGQFERQARPREMLRRCNLTPQRLQIPKQLRFRVEDEKRAFSADGETSRPFTVDEIVGRAGKGQRAATAEEVSILRSLGDVEERWANQAAQEAERS